MIESGLSVTFYEKHIFFQVYGGVFNLFRSELPKIGIECSFVDVTDVSSITKSLRYIDILQING